MAFRCREALRHEPLKGDRRFEIDPNCAFLQKCRARPVRLPLEVTAGCSWELRGALRWGEIAMSTDTARRQHGRRFWWGLCGALLMTSNAAGGDSGKETPGNDLLSASAFHPTPVADANSERLSQPHLFGFGSPTEEISQAYQLSVSDAPLYALSDVDAVVIRGQSPFALPSYGGTTTASPLLVPPGTSAYTGDPFQNAPTYDPYGGAMLPGGGVVGPQPMRLGWTERWVVGYLADADASIENTGAAAGSMTSLEADYVKSYSAIGSTGWTWTFAPELNYRSWGGPSTLGTAYNIPENLYRLAAGFRFDSPDTGPWHWQLGVTPSVNTDLESSLTSDAWQFDAQAAVFAKQSATLTWVLGAQYWDRRDGYIVPYAGLIWVPDQYWEFRLVLPKPRVEVFLGTPLGSPLWGYVGGEFRVESYQFDNKTSGNDYIESRDFRAYGGFRGEYGYFSHFIEAGAVLGREIESDGFAYEVDDGFMVRMGLQF